MLDPIDFVSDSFCTITLCFDVFICFPGRGMACCGKCWGGSRLSPRNLISRRLNEGESRALPFFEYARIPVGNDVKNAYATVMSADICSLTIWDCLAAPRRIFIFRSGFHFLIEVFLPSIPESSSIHGGGIKNCKAEKFRWEMKNHCIPILQHPDRYLWLLASSCFQVYDFHWKMMMHWHKRKNEMS